MLKIISHLLKMSGALKRAESLAGRAGRSDLQDLRSSRISTLTRVLQVVEPSDGVVNWIGPLKSLLDIVIVGFMIVLGRGPLCQVPFGRPEEANKVGRQVNVELLFFSKLSIGVGYKSQVRSDPPIIFLPIINFIFVIISKL